MSHTMKRRATVLATVISSLLIAGVVFAAFTADGAGAGSATSFEVLNNSDVNFDEVGGLYPGHTVDAVVEVVNNESFPAKVTDITFTTAVPTGSECDASKIDAVLAEALSDATLAAGGGEGSSEEYDVEITMDAGVGNECQNTPFTFTLGAELASVPDSTTP